MTRNKEKAFTLIELLVVISIIGLLSAGIIVSSKRTVTQGRDARRLEDLRQIGNAIQLYYSDHADVPTCYDSTPYPGGCDYVDNTSPGCPCISDTTRDESFLIWLSPYISSKILDPINQYDFYFYTSGQYPPNSGRYFKYLYGTFLENINDPALKNSLAPQSTYPGWYVLGEPK